MDDFPLLPLGFTAARNMAGYPIAFNAANEQAVAAFVQRRIRFVQLAEVTAQVMQEDWSAAPATVHEVMCIDAAARRCADKVINHLA